MSRKSKQKQAEQGTYALCITVGLIIGFGLGAIVSNPLVFTIAGAIVGGGAGWYFNHLKRSSRQ